MCSHIQAAQNLRMLRSAYRIPMTCQYRAFYNLNFNNAYDLQKNKAPVNLRALINHFLVPETFAPNLQGSCA